MFNYWSLRNVKWTNDSNNNIYIFITDSQLDKTEITIMIIYFLRVIAHSMKQQQWNDSNSVLGQTSCESSPSPKNIFV